MSEDTLEEDLHDDGRVGEHGGDDLSLLADGYANLLVQVGQTRL